MRTCGVCGKVLTNEDGRVASRVLKPNVIMFAALSMAGQLDRDSVLCGAESLSKQRPKTCHIHSVQAVQYILAEMVMAGKAISHRVDPTGSGRTAYVADGDIPESLVLLFNRMAEGSVSITARDIGNFVNDVLNRYYSTSIWPVTEEVGHERSCEEPGTSTQYEDSAGEEEEEEEEWASDFSEMSLDVSDSDEDASEDSSTSDSGLDAPMKETAAEALEQYYLVKGRQLIQLFRFCPHCGEQLKASELVAVGTAAVVRFACKKCSTRVQRWESQERTVPHTKERTHQGNVAASVAAITTGMRYVELERWAKELKLAFFSRSFFKKVFEWTKPAIEHVYTSQQRVVMDIVRGCYGKSVGLDLAADGAYDSRGYSALIGKVVLADTRTKLVLHTEVLHRSETGGVSGRMEVEGLRRLLLWSKSNGFSVASLTTDRSRSFSALLRRMEPEIGAIRHYYDGWHLVKWLGNELRKESKKKGCDLVTMWIEPLKTHLWSAIVGGAQKGLAIPPIFNTCLMHIRDVHEWPQDDITGPYLCCGHGPLEGPRPHSLDPGSKAYENVRNVVLSKSFQRDLAMASPYGGTSICESKNSLDRIYCRKEIFYPISTYHYYAKMCTMHMNSLRLAEHTKERKIVKTVEVQRKYLLRKSKLSVKSPCEQLWRKYIYQEVLARRLAHFTGEYAQDQDEEELYIAIPFSCELRLPTNGSIAETCTYPVKKMVIEDFDTHFVMKLF